MILITVAEAAVITDLLTMAVQEAAVHLAEAVSVEVVSPAEEVASVEAEAHLAEAAHHEVFNL